jgi:hypothetical protein
VKQSSIAELRDGERASLEGVVRATQPRLVAPLSGKPCVAHDSIGAIQDRPADGPPGGLVLAVLRLQAMTEFDLITSFGTVRIVGERAELAVPPTDLLPRSAEREIDFLQRCGKTADKRRFARFGEYIVDVGQRVVVGGTVQLELDPVERGYRDPPRSKVRLIATSAQPLTIGPMR